MKLKIHKGVATVDTIFLCIFCFFFCFKKSTFNIVFLWLYIKFLFLYYLHLRMILQNHFFKKIFFFFF